MTVEDDDPLVEALAKQLVAKRWRAQTWEIGLGGLGSGLLEKWRDAWRAEARGLLELVDEAGRLLKDGDQFLSTPHHGTGAIAERYREYRCRDTVSGGAFVSRSVEPVLRHGHDGVRSPFEPSPHPIVHETSVVTVWVDGSQFRSPWVPLENDPEVLASES